MTADQGFSKDRPDLARLSDVQLGQIETRERPLLGGEQLAKSAAQHAPIAEQQDRGGHR
jgi:hypothetical protein